MDERKETADKKELSMKGITQRYPQ